jgi:hypothetical protein
LRQQFPEQQRQDVRQQAGRDAEEVACRDAMERFLRELARGAKELADLVAHQWERQVAARRVVVQVQRQKARLPAVVQRRREWLAEEEAHPGATERRELREQVWPTRGAELLERCRVRRHLERKS